MTPGTAGRGRLFVPLALLALTAACDPGSRVSGGAPVELSITEAVAGSAEANLSPDGLFQLAPPLNAAHPQLTPERAVELANADLRVFGPNLLPYLERTHGAPIALDHLTPSPRVYYAVSPWQPLPATADLAVRQARGPFFLVTYVGPDGKPVLSSAVPAYATSVRFRRDGTYDPQSILSGFYVVGISREWNASLPISPEDAVVAAASATGLRVREVPELVLPGVGYKPQWSRWRVRLERPASLRRATGSQDEVRTDELFVGPRGDLYVAAARQPQAAVAPVRQGETIRLIRRTAAPVEFEKVIPASK
ncbi:MAG TPA: hypothetical protein VHG08_02465 [Longimicrobium sp.]|nr:hypothetical protein [Longimicrobium sp.]